MPEQLIKLGGSDTAENAEAEGRTVLGDTERAAAPHAPGTGDAQPASSCPDCGSPTERDESLPRPFDVTCAACFAMRAELGRRIKEAIDDLADAEEGLTDWYTVPVRPAWRVGGTNVWKRLVRS